MRDQPARWEQWAERSAMMEVAGGLVRNDAERQAFALLAVREGNHHAITYSGAAVTVV